MSPPEVNIVGKEPATPSLPLSQSTEYRRNNEIDVAIPQQNLSLQGYFDSSHSRDAQPPETEFCAANAQTASPDHQNLHTPCSNRVSRSNRDIMISLETPPTSGSFEWDERNGQPGGQKFVDGMGSLTSDVDGSGYLGIALSPKRGYYLSVQADTNSLEALLRELHFCVSPLATIAIILGRQAQG